MGPPGKRRLARLIFCTAANASEGGNPAADVVRRYARKDVGLRCDTTFEFNVPQVGPSAPSKSKWDVFCALYGSRDGLCECHGTEGDALLYEVIVGSDPLWRRVLASRASHAHCPRDVRLWYPLLKTTYSTATAADIAEIDARHTSLVGAAVSRKGRQLRSLMRDGEMMQSFASELLSSVGLDFGGPIEIGVAASVVYLVVDVFNGGLLMPPYLAKIALTELLSCIDGTPSSASEQVSSMTLVHALFRVVEPWAQTALLAEWRDMLMSVVRSVACTLTDAVRAVANELRSPSAPPSGARWEWRVPPISSRSLWIQYPVHFSEALDSAAYASHGENGSSSVASCGWTEEIAFDRLVVVRGGTWLAVRRADAPPGRTLAPPLAIRSAPAESTSEGHVLERRPQLVDELVQLSREYNVVPTTAVASSLGATIRTGSAMGTPAKDRASSALTTPSRPDSGFSSATEDVDWSSPKVKSKSRKGKHQKGEEQKQHWSIPLRVAMSREEEIVAAAVSVEPQMVDLKDSKGFVRYYAVDPGDSRAEPGHVCSGICVKASSRLPQVSSRQLPSVVRSIVTQRNLAEHEMSVWLHDERCSVQMCFLMSLQSLLRVLYDPAQIKCDAKVLFGHTVRSAEPVAPEVINMSTFEQDLQPKDTYGLLQMSKTEEAARVVSSPTPAPSSASGALAIMDDVHSFTYDTFVCCGNAQVDQLLRTALICNGGGVGLIRNLIQLAKEEQERVRRRARRMDGDDDNNAATGADDEDSEFAFFPSNIIANASHVSLVVEASPVDQLPEGPALPERSVAERTRMMHELAKKGMRCVSMCAAIATELRTCNDNMHVPMPLGGIQPRVSMAAHAKRQVNDEIPLAKERETQFLSRMPINRHYLFNFVKSDTEAALARSATPAVNSHVSHASPIGERCVSVPLRVVDGSNLRAMLEPLAPVVQTRAQPRPAPARDEGLEAPSSVAPHASTLKSFTPFAVAPTLLQRGERQGLEESVYAALFARSRSMSPNSKQAKKASDCLGSIAARATFGAKRQVRLSKITTRDGTTDGQATAALPVEQQADPIGAVQLQLASYAHAAKAVSEGRGDVARRPLDLR